MLTQTTILSTVSQKINSMGDSKRPKFYNKDIETWDYIAAHNLDFFEGNIIKYVTRHKSKNGLEDLEKARVYLDKLISITYKDYNHDL